MSEPQPETVARMVAEARQRIENLSVKRVVAEIEEASSRRLRSWWAGCFRCEDGFEMVSLRRERTVSDGSFRWESMILGARGALLLRHPDLGARPPRAGGRGPE